MDSNLKKALIDEAKRRFHAKTSQRELDVDEICAIALELYHTGWRPDCYPGEKTVFFSEI